MESYPCAVLRSAAKEKPTKGKDRVLRQMGRELLLAQSRDWAFLMKTGTAREYAAKRTKDHVLRFTRLYEQLGEENVDNACLENSEWRDNPSRTSTGNIIFDHSILEAWRVEIAPCGMSPLLQF